MAPERYRANNIISSMLNKLYQHLKTNKKIRLTSLKLTMVRVHINANNNTIIF